MNKTDRTDKDLSKVSESDFASKSEEDFDNCFKVGSTRLLLHACCGPCSMEPVRILRERGIEPHIYYSNSNIAPQDEYEHRRKTITEWTDEEKIVLIHGEYAPEKWEETAGKIAIDVELGRASREERCRLCYRQRFEESARYAADNGYDAIGTTLSVSPYQYTDIIKEELECAAKAFGLKCAFEDYSPFYDEATRRSREAGMYRQNYCGCVYSKAEAQRERAERKAQRQQERTRYLEEHADEIAEKEAALQQRRAKRAEYDKKQSRKHAILKELRAKRKMEQ